MSPSTTLELTSEFIKSQYERHLLSSTTEKKRALVIGIQGPQGSGKSYLASQLELHLPTYLSSSTTSTSSPSTTSRPLLRVVNLSLDDLYHSHSNLSRIARENKGNSLLEGRGQAGTHDLELGSKVLSSLRRPHSTDEGQVVKIPRFEKSLFGGQGDRVPEEEWTKVQGNVDIVLFEGWMLGFSSIPSISPSSFNNNDNEDPLSKLYSLAQNLPSTQRELEAQTGRLSYSPPFFLSHQLEHLKKINKELKEYEERLWDFVDGWIELKPEELGYVWDWRLEQEHSMKAKNGGIGMTDDQVKEFISRYMPGYELFSSSSRIGKTKREGDDEEKEKGKGRNPILRIEIGKKREVVGVEEIQRDEEK